MATRRTILDSLTRKDLLDLAKAFDIAGLTARSKAEVVEALAASRSFTTENLVAQLSRNQLKAVCRAAGLPDHGREKQLLADRLLNGNGRSPSSPSETNGPSPATSSPRAGARDPSETSMAKQRNSKGSTSVTNFRHKKAKRKNNPPAKLAAEGTVPVVPKAKYAYNPHLPPKLRFGPDGDYEPLLEKAQRQALSAEEAQQLAQALEARQPWLEWAEKQEQDARGHFDVGPVALHIHERVSAQAILKVAARQDAERSLFADPQQEYHEAVQFYRHDIDWTNRLILGDSLQVMSSLAHREDLAGRVQMIYIDPPYGIRFASNFQPEVSRRDVGDREKDLTREAEMVRAYRDTWHLGVHSYLSYLRDRLMVAKELLAETGSLFVQIGDENVHRVRSLLDEVFGVENGVGFIPFVTTAGLGAAGLPNVCDYLLWYAKSKPSATYHQLFRRREYGDAGSDQYRWLFSPTGEKRTLTPDERATGRVPERGSVFRPDNLTSGAYRENTTIPYTFEGTTFHPGSSKCWKTTREGLDRLAAAGRLTAVGRTLAYVRHLDDFPVQPIKALWTDTGTGGFGDDKLYVVQTTTKAIMRCMLMTTDPGDLVLDPTCGSGTTAYVAEQWGRRWITIDTSRVAVSLARQRLLTGKFDRYRLEDEADVVNGNGKGIDPSHNFKYKTVPHITLGSIARNENLDPIFAKHESILDEALAACNAALKEVDNATRLKLEQKLAAKQKQEGKRAITEADRRRWQLPKEGFEHWTVPFDTDDDWPKALRNAVWEYRGASIAKMEEVNQCIADNAEQETLVDQPEVVKGVVRVTGPFTVEAVQPPEMSLGDVVARGDDPVEAGFAGEPGELEETFASGNGEGEPVYGMRMVEPRPDLDAQNVDAYLDQMMRLIKGDGVRFPNNRHMTFTRLERLEGTLGLHADGRWVVADKDGKSAEEDADPDGRAFVAVAFGPQYGPVTAKMVEDCMRSANRMGYDELVVAGFSFDGPAQAVIEENPNPNLRIHQANIRPDVNPAMEGLLKEQAGSELFTVFGQPRTLLHGPEADGEYRITMEGVDIFDPVENTVRSTGADKVAAWFLDSDYDGRTFCITQAFFPDRNAWDKLGKALKGVVDEDAFEKLSGTDSLPFPMGKHGRAAVKVIDPRGNEVMRVHELG